MSQEQQEEGETSYTLPHNLVARMLKFYYLFKDATTLSTENHDNRSLGSGVVVPHEVPKGSR